METDPNHHVVPAHIPTPVLIEEDSDDLFSKNSLGRLKKFRSKFTFLEPMIFKNDSLFKLHYPSTNYWVFDSIDRSMKNETFNKIASENFSDSFLWLLKECSRIVRCSLLDLFTELVIIERVYDILFADGVIGSYNKINIFPKEWW